MFPELHGQHDLGEVGGVLQVVGDRAPATKDRRQERDRRQAIDAA